MQRRGFILHILNQLRDAAQFGLHSRFDNDRFAAPVGDRCAHIDHITPVSQRSIRFRQRLGHLAHWQRFASQRGFLNAQVGGFDHATIGWNNAARFQQHHITRNQTMGLDVFHVTVTAHPHQRRGHLFERGHRLFRAVFLHHTQHRVQHHDQHNGDHTVQFAKHGRDAGRKQQQQHQRAGNLFPENFEGAGQGFFGQFIGAVLLKATFGFGLSQPGSGGGV